MELVHGPGCLVCVIPMGRVDDGIALARRRGLATMAIVGYDGGRVAAEELAVHVVVIGSENIPRIQEAQASAYHVLRELVEAAE